VTGMFVSFRLRAPLTTDGREVLARRKGVGVRYDPSKLHAAQIELVVLRVLEEKGAARTTKQAKNLPARTPFCASSSVTAG
jgi:hypothetical protein